MHGRDGAGSFGTLRFRPGSRGRDCASLENAGAASGGSARGHGGRGVPEADGKRVRLLRLAPALPRHRAAHREADLRGTEARSERAGGRRGAEGRRARRRRPGLTTDADEGSPVVPLRLAVGAAAGDENALLADVARRARAEGVGVCVAVNPRRREAQTRAEPTRRRQRRENRREDQEGAAIIAKAAKDALGARARRGAVAAIGHSPRRRSNRGGRCWGPKKRRESSDVAPASPAKAPGVSVTLDGTIALNAELYPRVLLRVPLIGIRRPSENPPRSPARGSRGGGPSGGPMSRSQSWSAVGGGDERGRTFSSSAGDFGSPVTAPPPARARVVACGATATAPGLSVPLLVITLYLHNLFRRYILTQIDVTSRLVPSWLRRVGLPPSARSAGARGVLLRRDVPRLALVPRGRRFPRWFGPWTARSRGW